MGIGEDFAHAVAAKDREALERLLAPDVDFKGLTPGRLWEASDPAGVSEVFFGSWFDAGDTVERLVGLRAGEPVADTEHVSYRLDLANGGGPQVAEQQVYYRAEGGRIAHLRVLCSGFRPRS